LVLFLKVTKNYPATVRENKTHFDRFLSLLTTNGIRPVVTVVPGHRSYVAHIATAMENEFKDIIGKFQQQYSFDFFDGMRSKKFSDNDFYDDNHMNETGAKKFTARLNRYIQ